MGTTNTLYLPHRINIAMRFNFNTIFYVQYRSEEISPPAKTRSFLSKIVRFVVPKTYIQVFCSCFENQLVNICFKQGQPKSEVIHFFGSHFSQPRGIHHLLLVCLHEGDTYVTESWNLIHISVSKNQKSMLHLGLTISYYLLFVD